MKIIVDKLPENAKDCLFAEYDCHAVGYGVYKCMLSSGYCYMSYSYPCPFLITNDNKRVI